MFTSTRKKYDVFISFRGEDTRKNFTGKLHEALKKENIETYIDLYVKVGDEVGPMLIQAIHDSQISVIVFSKNFVTSKWCLEELLHILECRKHHGQVVLPFFYETDPSNIVGIGTGSYEKAFARYERELMNNQCDDLTNPEKVSKWKAALVEVAAISARDSCHYSDDSQFIQCILKDVLQTLSRLYPNELRDLIQIDEKGEEVENYLKKVPRIGIWGMEGLGKTTIARQMFSKHFMHFDSACFLESISQRSKKFGLPYLRDKLLNDLLKQHITTSDFHGISGKKVFIVLDDVDNCMQLDYLCGELNDLAPNSRIIITTRNRDTLNGRVDEIYEVEKWKFKESLEVFSLAAFKQKHPKVGYECLSERAVACARGVPLALKVLGSHFHSRNLEFWELELNYLDSKRESLCEIQDVLRVSYNGLEEQEKEMFLDIAFFFKDENKDFVISILDACGFDATSGIHILEDKALVTISNDNKIQMHDLHQKLAFDIVQYKKDQTRKDPQKCSRLRDIEEVCGFLKNNKGTHNKVEGITFDLTKKVDLHIQDDTFNLITKLRFLRLYVPLGKKRLTTLYHPDQGIMPFCDKLRYLEWYGYPMKSLPQPFCTDFLVEIRLPHSHVEHLWHGIQELVNLEGMDLTECKQLVKLPDLSKATRLKWLFLSGCESLSEVQPSTFHNDTLVTLLLDRCKKLESLVIEKHLTSLKNIDVNGCSSLMEFSLSSDSIEGLDLSNTIVKTLNPSIGRMSNLLWLNLQGLRLQNVPKELSHLRSLTQLWISNCNVVTKSKLEEIFEYHNGLESLLKTLVLKDCGNLFELPANIDSLSSLYELRLDGSNVKMLPTNIKYLSNLSILSLNNCKMLISLPELPEHIKELRAENCSSLVEVSTLKTMSKHRNGDEKYISFKNGKKLESNELSLNRITEDTILVMKSVALYNVLVDKRCSEIHSYNYDSVVMCLPGSIVPSQLKYRTTASKITIGFSDIYYSLGFIFAVVVSPSNEMKNEHGSGAKIQCKCYTEDGSQVGVSSEWHSEPITNLDMDHVFVWYDPYRFGIIQYISEGNVSFEFNVTSDSGEHDCFLSVKECGICPIFTSEFFSLLDMLNLDKDVESCMRRNIQCDEIYHEIKDNDIESHEG